VNKFDEALRDLEQSTIIEGNSSSTANYYKGVIYYRRKMIVEALLCF
jgi:hypothetical protein